METNPIRGGQDAFEGGTPRLAPLCPSLRVLTKRTQFKLAPAG